jgi:peptidoglycan/LPS O-acetylase OafA/YrhL
MPRLRTQKYDNINLLRAIAALAVVVYHVIEHGHWTAIPRDGALGYLHLGWLGVHLFFTVSGFVIAYSALMLYRRAPREFAGAYWRRRLARILPLYLLTVVAWVAVTSGSFFGQPVREQAWQLVTHLTFTHNFWLETHGTIDGVNWSLAVEMQFYILVALLIGWIDRTPGWRIWLYAILISWAWRAAMFAQYADAGAYVLHVKTTQLPGVLDEFGAGIFLAKWVLDGHRLPGKGLAAVIAAAATWYVAMQLYWPRAMYWDNGYMVVFWHTALSLALLFAVAVAVELPQVIGYRWLQPLDWLGEVSYGIYLWHLFAIMLAIQVLGLKGIASLAAVLALTIGAAALSWRYFEKPIMDRARRRPVKSSATGFSAEPAQSAPETPSRPPP